MRLQKRKSTTTPVATQKEPMRWERDYIMERPARAVGAFLTSSYLYYHRDDMTPIMSDSCFDWLCTYLLRNWRRIEHPHKHLIDREMLMAGTGFNIRADEYPTIVKQVAIKMSNGTLLDYLAPPDPSAPAPTPRRKLASRKKQLQRRGNSGFF